MRKSLCLSAVAAIATAFVFAGPADAGKGGVKGSKQHAAFNVFVGDPVPCADAVSLVPPGSIEVGLFEPQCYTYDMVIEDAALGTVHRDELTANWDLDGASEAAVDDDTGINGSAAAEDAVTGGNEGGVTNVEELDAADGFVDGDCDNPLALGNVVLCSTVGEAAALATGDCSGTDGLCDGNFVDNICDDGACDGVDLIAGCFDSVCDGLRVLTQTNLTCSVFASRPDSAVKLNAGNVPAKQPEILVVTIDTVGDADNECTVQVSARTVLNPGDSDPSGGADPDLFDDCGVTDVCAFEPRKCEPLREFTRFDPDGDGVADNEDTTAGVICTDGDACMSGGVPFINFETMNLGIKSYAANGAIIVNGDNFVATKLSVELDPFDCDIDGDGEPDATDAEPLNPDVQS